MPRNRPLRIAFYDPFIRTAGGGEKYILAIAEYVAELGHEAHIIIDDPKIDDCEQFIQNAGSRLNLDLSRVVITSIKRNPFRSLWWKLGLYSTQLTHYDFVIYLANQLPHVSFNRNCLAIVQFPLEGALRFRPSLRFIRQCYRHKALNRINACIVYSDYTARWIRKFWGRESIVVHPPVDTADLRADQAKENIILGVGRFDEKIHNKKQPELVSIFKRMVDSGLDGWQLVLIGGVLKDNHGLIDELKEIAMGYPVQILPNTSFGELCGFYAKSKIFWHATGLNENEDKYPERSEHFGITTVEAMASGCVPVVINKGGQPEIVEHGECGYLWDTPQDLVDQTVHLINNPQEWQALSHAAIVRSRRFGKEEFRKRILAVLNQYVDGLT